MGKPKAKKTRRHVRETANNVRGEYPVTLGSKTIVLLPDFDRIQEMEALLRGASFIQIVQDLTVHNQYPSLTNLVTIVHTLARPPKPPRKKLGPLLLKHGITEAVHAVATIGSRILSGELEEPDDDDDDDDDDDEGEGDGTAGGNDEVKEEVDPEASE